MLFCGFQSLGASNAPIVPTKVLGDPDELDRHLVESGYAESVAPPPPEPALVDRYEDRYVYRRGPGVDLELLVSFGFFTLKVLVIVVFSV